jgi:hypothetical protein
MIMTKDILQVSEFDAITQEHIVRDMTADEIADMSARKARADIARENEAKAASDKAALLIRLGITADEAALLVG